MASAKVVVKEVEKVIKEKVEEVQLILTREEAEVLLLIGYHVGGPESGHRGKMTNITNSLSKLGINRAGGSVTGSIYF